MASRRQIEANRRNARKSTGLKSRAGKRRASKNAIRHGLHRQLEIDEVLPFYEAITAQYDLDLADLADDPRARLAWNLAETEARLTDVKAIEGAVWQRIGEGGEDRTQELPAGASAAEIAAYLNMLLGYNLDPEKLAEPRMAPFLSTLRQMAMNPVQPLKPSLARRYRNEAEAARGKALRTWIDTLDQHRFDIDDWFDHTYETLSSKRSNR